MKTTLLLDDESGPAAWAAAHEEDAAEVWAEMIAASKLPE